MATYAGILKFELAMFRDILPTLLHISVIRIRIAIMNRFWALGRAEIEAAN